MSLTTCSTSCRMLSKNCFHDVALPMTTTLLRCHPLLLVAPLFHFADKSLQVSAISSSVLPTLSIASTSTAKSSSVSGTNSTSTVHFPPISISTLSIYLLSGHITSSQGTPIPFTLTSVYHRAKAIPSYPSGSSIYFLIKRARCSSSPGTTSPRKSATHILAT